MTDAEVVARTNKPDLGPIKLIEIDNISESVYNDSDDSELLNDDDYEEFDGLNREFTAVPLPTPDNNASFSHLSTGFIVLLPMFIFTVAMITMVPSEIN